MLRFWWHNVKRVAGNLFKLTLWRLLSASDELDAPPRRHPGDPNVGCYICEGGICE